MIRSLVVVLGLIFITYNNASACVCMIQKDLKKAIITEFNYTPLVFSGKIIAVEYIPTIQKDHWGKEIKGKTLAYRFSVDKLWKGESKGEVILNTEAFISDTFSVSKHLSKSYPI